MTDTKTKKPGKTHVLLITDMSGSMGPLAQDVRGGFNTYVTDLKADASGADCRLSVCLFDTVFEPLCTDAALCDVPELTVGNYQPRGMTALLDAVGKTITEFESRTKLRKRDRVLVVIQTDGHENSSAEYGLEQIQDMIAEREKTDRWSFIFLGAGADAWAQGAQFGLAPDQVIRTAATGAGTRSTYSGLTHASVAYASGASGVEASGIVQDWAGDDDSKDAS